MKRVTLPIVVSVVPVLVFFVIIASINGCTSADEKRKRPTGTLKSAKPSIMMSSPSLGRLSRKKRCPTGAWWPNGSEHPMGQRDQLPWRIIGPKNLFWNFHPAASSHNRRCMSI